MIAIIKSIQNMFKRRVYSTLEITGHGLLVVYTILYREETIMLGLFWIDIFFVSVITYLKELPNIHNC